jgi:diguanylate cyclase (GGDEF)-like protein
LHQIDNSNIIGVGLIICDIDGLKTINDRMGHTVGDRLLTECAAVLCTSVGDNGISRIGGDEFAILLEHCTEAEMANAADKIRQALDNYNSKNPMLPLSMSIGCAMKFSPEISMTEVFRLADNLMYKEKPANHKHFQEIFAKIPGSQSSI